MIERMDVGDEYVNRMKDDSPSERVRIVSLGPPKQHRRIVVEHLDGERAGETQDVPVRRLKAPWSEVERYDRQQEMFARFGAIEYEIGEEAAAQAVFRILIPSAIADFGSAPVYFSTAIRSPDELTTITGVDTDELLERFESVEFDGGLLVSGMATLCICELACRTNPMPMLDDLRERETEAMIRSKNGHTEHRQGLKGGEAFTAYEDHERYLTFQRPEFELIRQWCGNRAVSFQERMIAAEQECHRLELVLINALKRIHDTEGESWEFRRLRDDYNIGRVTPESVRPIVERPLRYDDCPPPPGPNRGFGRRWW
jgi:hypothetical protein